MINYIIALNYSSLNNLSKIKQSKINKNVSYNEINIIKLQRFFFPLLKF